MDRLIGAILAGICFVLQMQAQAPNAEAPKGKSAVEQTPAPPGKTPYPLDSFTDFSAIMIGSMMEPGEGTAEAHIYRSGKLMRMEGIEGRGYLITDLSTLETYGMSSGPCMRDTHPYFRSSPFAASRPGSTVVRSPAGKEMVDGHSCQVEEVSITPPTRGVPPLKMRLWEADDLQGFPIKIQYLRPGGHDIIVRYKNVVLGPQDPTLFIHPKSCASLSKPKSKASKASPKSKQPAATAPPGSSPQ
jgi:hypothetical protein